MVTTTKQTNNQVNLVQVCSLNIEQSRLLQKFMFQDAELFEVSLAGPLNISSQGWNKGRNQVREMQKPGKAKLPSQVHRPWSVPIPSYIFRWFRREIFWALQIPFTRPVPWMYWAVPAAPRQGLESSNVCNFEILAGTPGLGSSLFSFVLHLKAET